MLTLFIVIALGSAIALVAKLLRPKSGLQRTLDLLRTEQVNWMPDEFDPFTDILYTDSLWICRRGMFGSGDETVTVQLREADGAVAGMLAAVEYKNYEPVAGGPPAKQLQVAVRKLLIAAGSRNAIRR